MTALFFYGTLRHLPLLEVVLGHAADTVPAALPGHRALTVSGATWPTIAAGRGAAEGTLLRDPSTQDLARLDFYEGAYDYLLRDVVVDSADGPVAARVYFPTAAQPAPDRPWDFPAWEERHAAIAVAAAREAMGLMGRLSAAEVRARYFQIRVRGASAVRAAAEPAPAARCSDRSSDAVEILATRRPYTEYFALIEQDLRFPTFDGGRSAPATRVAFRQGDAVSVLPWDPVRDRVLLVEQFRYGLYARGDPRPWSLEPIAGRIDPGEAPQAAARREALEEARIELGALHEVARYYPSPGASSEWVISYVAIANLPDGIETVAGEAGEAEDVRGHLVPLAEVLEMIRTGEVAHAPLILSAQWLALHRDRLATPPGAV